MAATIHIPGGEGNGASIDGSVPLPCSLDVTTEMIDVSTGLPTRRPDPTWEKVDKQGHFHAFTTDGKLPTLATESIQKPCPGGCDDPGCEGVTVIRYRCRLCRQKIRPNWVTEYDPSPRSMPGRTNWSVTVRGGPILVATGEVSVKVTAEGRTYFGFGMIGDVTWRNDGGRPETEMVIHGMSELGRRSPTLRPAPRPAAPL